MPHPAALIAGVGGAVIGAAYLLRRHPSGTVGAGDRAKSRAEMEDELRRNFEDANYRGFSHADKHGGLKITGGPTSELPGRASGSASPWPDVQDSPAGDVVRSVGRAIGSGVATAANAVGVVGTEPAPKPVGDAGGELQLQRKTGGQVDWERSRPSMSPKARAGQQPLQPGAPAPQAGRADLPPIQQTPAGTLERNVGDRTDAIVRASDVGVQRPPAAPLPREGAPAVSSKIERSTVVTKGAAPANGGGGGVIDSIVHAAESVKDAVVDTVHKVEDKLAGAANKVEDKLAGAANKVEDTVASGAHKVEDSLSRNIGQFVQGAEETTRRAADTAAELSGRGVRRAEEAGYRVEEGARRGKERLEADLGRAKDRFEGGLSRAEADVGRGVGRLEGEVSRGFGRAEEKVARGVGRLEEGAERLGERFRGERGGYTHDEELHRGAYAATGPLTRSHVGEERGAVLGQSVPQQSQGIGAGSTQLRQQEEYLSQRGGGARSPREDALQMRSQIDNSIGKLGGYGERLKAEGGRFKDELKQEGRALKDEGRALKEEGKDAFSRLEAGVKGQANKLREEGRGFIRGAEDKIEGGAARLRGDWERATGGKAVDVTRGGYMGAAEDYSRQSPAANVTPERTADRFGREGAAAAGGGRYGYGAAAPGDYSGYSDASGARRDDYGRGSSPDATNQSFTQRGTAAGSTTYGNAGSGYAPVREGGLLGPRKRAGEPGSVEGVGGERRDMLTPPPGVAAGGYNAAGDYTYAYRAEADQAAPAARQYRSEGAAAGGWGKPKAHGYMTDHAAAAHAPGAASRGFVDGDRAAAGVGDQQQLGRDRFEGGFPLQGRDSPSGGTNAQAASRERFEGGFPLEGSRAPLRSSERERERGRERESRATDPNSGRPGGAGFDGLIDAPYRGLGGDYGSVYGYPDPATAALYQKERDQARESSHMAGAAAISGAAQQRGAASWGTNAWERADRSEHAPGSEGVGEGFGIKREELGKAPLQGPPKLARPAAGFGASGSSPAADRSSVLR
jgi:hypothetical protein